MVEFLWKSESRGYKIVQINSIPIQFYQFTLIFSVWISCDVDIFKLTARV